jgi:hypothetical protein
MGPDATSQTRGKLGLESTSNLVSLRPPGGVVTPGIIKIRLQPQMKKYRSLWYVSTRNHNILYFVCVPRTRLLNTATCLWKAQKSLAGRGLSSPKVRPLFDASPVLPVAPGHPLQPCLSKAPINRRPARTPPQDARTVQIPGAPVLVVEIWCDLAKWRRCGAIHGSNRDLIGSIRWCRTRTIKIPPVTMR